MWILFLLGNPASALVIRIYPFSLPAFCRFDAAAAVQSFMDKIPRCTRGVVSVQSGDGSIAFLLNASDVALLAHPSVHWDSLHPDVVGMRVGTSKSETMVLPALYGLGTSCCPK